MKKYLFLIIGLTLFVSACEESNLNSGELIGVWQLSEVLADPGDGSGTFQPTTDDIKISFFTEGNLFVEPGIFYCTGLILYDNFNGKYDTTTSVLIPFDCKFGDNQAEYDYELNADNELIVYLPCIEPCANKFVKVSDK